MSQLPTFADTGLKFGIQTRRTQSSHRSFGKAQYRQRRLWNTRRDIVSVVWVDCSSPRKKVKIRILVLLFLLFGRFAWLAQLVRALVS